MPTFIALLRAINLGPHNPVAMAALKKLFDELGFAEVRTVLQTGNVVFQGTIRDCAAMEGLLEQETKERMGITTDFFVRSRKEWERLIETNPFPDQARDDPARLVAMILKEPPARDSLNALRAAIKGREKVGIEGRTAYIAYPDGIGRSRLTTALIEAKLGVRGTGRNWNTVLKLAALAG